MSRVNMSAPTSTSRAHLWGLQNCTPEGEFILFPLLPIEIRQMIWRIAVPTTRRVVQVEYRVPSVVDVEADYEDLLKPGKDAKCYAQSQLETFGFTSSNPRPAANSLPNGPANHQDRPGSGYLYSRAWSDVERLAQTCKQSRAAVKEEYELAFSTASSTARVWFNFKRDALYLSCDSIFFLKYYRYPTIFRLAPHRYPTPFNLTHFVAQDLRKLQFLALQYPKVYFYAHDRRMHMIRRVLTTCGNLAELHFVEGDSAGSDRSELHLIEFEPAGNYRQYTSQMWDLLRVYRNRKPPLWTHNSDLQLGSLERKGNARYSVPAVLHSSVTSRVNYEFINTWERPIREAISEERNKWRMLQYSCRSTHPVLLDLCAKLQALERNAFLEECGPLMQEACPDEEALDSLVALEALMEEEEAEFAREDAMTSWQDSDEYEHGAPGRRLQYCATNWIEAVERRSTALPKLPIEIRQMIWKLALPTKQRVVHVERSARNIRTGEAPSTDHQDIVLLHSNCYSDVERLAQTCSDARAIVKTEYELVFPDASGTSRVWFNFSRDVLYLGVDSIFFEPRYSSHTEAYLRRRHTSPFDLSHFRVQDLRRLRELAVQFPQKYVDLFGRSSMLEEVLKACGGLRTLHLVEGDSAGTERGQLALMDFEAAAHWRQYTSATWDLMHIHEYLKPLARTYDNDYFNANSEFSSLAARQRANGPEAQRAYNVPGIHHASITSRANFEFIRTWGRLIIDKISAVPNRRGMLQYSCSSAHPRLQQLRAELQRLENMKFLGERERHAQAVCVDKETVDSLVAFQMRTEEDMVEEEAQIIQEEEINAWEDSRDRKDCEREYGDDMMIDEYDDWRARNLAAA